MKNFFLHRVPFWISFFSLGSVLLITTAFFFKVHQVIENRPLSQPVRIVYSNHVYGGWIAANENFYNQTLDGFIGQGTTFINADLSTMQLQYYKNGTVAMTIPILSKGRPGSWWETPTGLYRVQNKTPADFSDMARVYSPWALDFVGNFLIHGWPYYPGGTPVGSTYSGGCIRLPTADAKTLYGMVDVGTPVLVYDADFVTDGFKEQQKPQVWRGPRITAKSYLAVDLDSNYVLAQKNPDEQLPIASITKLMTALVAIEYVNIEKTITITPDMIVKTSIPRLKVGQKYRLYDLLQPLLKESSNEAAVAISDFLGPKYFVSLMNQQAAAIGMTNTHFVDPTGSDWGNVSDAHDLFILTQYLYDNRGFVLDMTTNENIPNAYGPSAFPSLENFNVFANSPDFIGGKVGINGAASDTIVSAFNEPFAAQISTTTVASVGQTDDEIFESSTTTSTVPTGVADRPIVLIILGSDDYTSDANIFLQWIKNSYN